MTLAELIIEYRSKNELSQRQFAMKCQLSNGYISMVERGVNPTTGEPIIPTLQAYYKFASGMNMTINELFQQIDDAPVDFEANKEPFSSEEKGLVNIDIEIASLFMKLSPENKRKALSYLQFLAASGDN